MQVCFGVKAMNFFLRATEPLDRQNSLGHKQKTFGKTPYVQNFFSSRKVAPARVDVAVTPRLSLWLLVMEAQV